MIFWICTISVLCIITGATFRKPYLGIVFVIISIPFEDSIIFDSVSIYPSEAVLTIIFFICVFKFVIKRKNYFKNTKLALYYIPFMLCILISALKSMEFSLTVKEIVRWVELIAVYFLAINLITDYKKVRVILYSMFFSTAIVSICGIVSYLSGVESVYIGRPGAYSFFGHPNALAGYVNLIIPVLVGILMTSVSLWERITLGVTTVLSIMAWFLTFSRTSWISLVLAIFFILITIKVKKRVVVLLVMLFVVFAITFLSSNIRDNVKDRFVLNEAVFRVMLYPIGFNMVKEDLLFGIGIGNYPLLIKNFTEFPAVIKNDLHGLYLQIFVEAGMIGLCAFLFWLACIIKYLVRSIKSLERSRNYGLFVGLLGGVIVYLINNLTNVLTVHGIHLQWGIILGLAVLVTQFRGAETCSETV